MEVNEFYLAVKIFNQRGATFHPVAAVQVFHTVNLLHLGPVNMSANHAISLMVAGHGGQRGFIFGHELHSGLGLELQKRCERPVTETHRASQAIEVEVKVENPVVKVRSKFFKQMIEMRQTVGLVAMDDEIFLSVSGGVHRLPRHGDAAKTHAHELFNELVVVAGDINDLGVFAAFAQQLLDERVVIVAPEPAEFQFPAVDKIAHKVEVLAIHQAQEVQQLAYSGVPCAKMDI